MGYGRNGGLLRRDFGCFSAVVVLGGHPRHLGVRRGRGAGRLVVLHLERVGDELIMTVQDDDEPDGMTIVVAFDIPDGVDEFIRQIEHEVDNDDD